MFLLTLRSLVVVAIGLGLLAQPAAPAIAQGAKQGEQPQDKPAPRSKSDDSSESMAPDDKGTAPKGAVPKGAVPAPDGKGSANSNTKNKAAGKQQSKAPPPIAVLQPRTPAEREKALNDLYALLATAESEVAAKSVSANIERLWLTSGSDTVSVLMDRAMLAQQGKQPALALKLLDAVVELAPDFAEGWNRRAYVHFSQSNIELALGDLRRVLALDPSHFKALDGLAHILREVGQKKAALAAVRKLMEVHPYWDGAKTMHDELARDVEGQAL